MRNVQAPGRLVPAAALFVGLTFAAAPVDIGAITAVGDSPAAGTPPAVDVEGTGSATFDELLRAAPGLDAEVLELALRAARNAEAAGVATASEHLTVIDYSMHSSEARMWVLDLETSGLLFHERVTHGSGTGSGSGEARTFSNVPGSRQSSLGLFVTGETYWGRNGYSLRMHGLDEGFNDKAFERAIVIHGADYAREEFVERTGRLGRSWGCPAVADHVAEALIDTIKEGSLVFAYYPHDEWLAGSSLLAED